MGRHILLSVLFWILCSYLVIALFELVVFGWFDWTASIPNAIGGGIGFAVVMRMVSPRDRES